MRERAGVPQRTPDQAAHAVHDRPILERGDRLEADGRKRLRHRSGREGLLMGEIAVSDAHAIEPFRVGYMRDAHAAGTQHACHAVEHGEELVARQMLEHVDEQNDVERLVPGAGKTVVDVAAPGLEEAQRMCTRDLLARDVDAGDLAVAGLEEEM